MQYSVIYSVDIPEGVNMRPFVPPQFKKLWQETEDDSSYEYGYLEGCWEKGHHRKWCALLSQEEFDEFVQHVGIFAENVQTMGSLGAPGFGFGWAPAISFRSDDPDAIQSAYVTPVGERDEIVEFIDSHNADEEGQCVYAVPQVLLDSCDQQHLDGCEGQIRSEREAVWETVRSIVIERYSS